MRGLSKMPNPNAHIAGTSKDFQDDIKMTKRQSQSTIQVNCGKNSEFVYGTRKT